MFSYHKLLVDVLGKNKDMVVGDKVSGQELVATERVEDGDEVILSIEDAHTYICRTSYHITKRQQETKQQRNHLIHISAIRYEEEEREGEDALVVGQEGIGEVFVGEEVEKVSVEEEESGRRGRRRGGRGGRRGEEEVEEEVEEIH